MKLLLNAFYGDDLGENEFSKKNSNWKYLIIQISKIGKIKINVKLNIVKIENLLKIWEIFPNKNPVKRKIK